MLLGGWGALCCFLRATIEHVLCGDLLPRPCARLFGALFHRVSKLNGVALAELLRLLRAREVLLTHLICFFLVFDLAFLCWFVRSALLHLFCREHHVVEIHENPPRRLHATHA